MAGAALVPLAPVAAGGGRRELLPNSCSQSGQSRYEKASSCASVSRMSPKIVCLRRNSRQKSMLPLRQLAESCEALKSRPRKSLLRVRRISAGLGECCISFAQQNLIFHRMRGASTVCKVQSVEGTEKSIDPDTNFEQKKPEFFSERQEGNGESAEARSVRFDTSRTDAKQEDLVSSDEKIGSEADDEHNSGNPQNGNISPGESNDNPSDIRTGTIPPEELEDYGTEKDWDEEVEYVTRISVPREKYIPVPKVDLVNALLLLFSPGNTDTSNFYSICSYLEIILHAEHKVVLEELRSDYSLTSSVQDGKKSPQTGSATGSSKLGSASTERAEKHVLVGEQPDWPVDSRDMDDGFSKIDKQQPLKALKYLGATLMTALKQQRNGNDVTADTVEGDSSGPTNDAELSEAAAQRFQKNFLKMLRRAEFEGISIRDLELTSALNSDYLLSTPVDVDWKLTSSSNVKIFRRGYTKQEQKGLLLGAKFDYLLSLIVRQMFKKLTGPLLHSGRWCIQKWNSLWDGEEGRVVIESIGRWLQWNTLWDGKESRVLVESISRWLQEPLQPKNEEPPSASQQSTDDETVASDRESQLNMPIWLAARLARPRYEAVLSSAGSRGLLIRRILVRMGLLQVEPPSQTLLTDGDQTPLEPHLRPNHLSRVSMKDIWLPASKAVVGRNPVKMISAAFSVFFSQATLQEPAFKELVLLYNAIPGGDSEDAGLQLQTYKKIPLPDLKIVFPSKKLIFRVLDTVRLDITSIVGLLAFTVNYRFDDFLSSPSAFVLDVIATSALVVLVTRVGFGYKQVWDRYQLLVNKTLYEKTVASGFGVVQFLLDESEEQQFKEAVLVFTLLLHQSKAEFGERGMTIEQLSNSCERFLYYRCKVQVDMPVDSAVSTLLKLGLIVCNEETSTAASQNMDVRFRALPCEEGLKALEQHWVSLPCNMSLWN